MERPTTNPWLGLRSYQEGETLYGRTEDIDSLAHCVLSNVHTTVYGHSGIGKTSVLNAGVFPIARRNDVFPVNIRLKHNSNPYISQIRKSIETELLHLRKEVYDENGDKHPEFVEGSFKELVKPVGRDGKEESLWEYFHRYVFFDDKGKRIIPLIVFDQFEEIFTLEKKREKVRDFFHELGDLLNGIMPDYLTKATIPPQDTSDGKEVGIEDIPLEPYTSASGEFEYLTSSDFHLVITLRDDFLSYLEIEAARIPALRQNRYCLQPINEEQAAVIIMNPVRGLVDRSVAKLIIEKVTGETEFELDGKPELPVDSAILSLYLSRLYDRLGDNDTVITADLVESEDENIIADFYEDSISGIPPEIVEFLEDNLINGEGRRENISIFKAKQEGKLSSEMLQTLIEERKLLRQFGHDGGLRLEFIHDTLCPVIQRRKEQRQAIKQQQEIERQNQREAARLEQERQSIALSKAKNRKMTAFLATAAVSLAAIAVMMALLSSRNKTQSRELDTLTDRLRQAMPVIIEQRLKDGDNYAAENLLLRQFPDTLYCKGDPVRTVLLRQLSGSNALTLYGHAQSVNAARFSKDMRMAVTGSDDMTVKLWDTQTGNPLSSISIAPNAVSSLDISDDGKMLAVASKKGAVMLYQIADGKAVPSGSISVGESYARFVTFNPDGSEIWACMVNGPVIVYKTVDLSEINSIKAGKSGATYISFDKTGTRVAIAGSDKTITVRDIATKETIVLNGHTDWVRSVEFSPDGNQLVSCSDDNTVRLWERPFQNAGTIIKVLPNWGTKAAFTPDGKWIVSSSKDGVLRFVDMATKNEISEMQIKHSGYLSDFDISSDGHRIIACSSTPVVHIWDCGETMDTGISLSLSKPVYGLCAIAGTTRFAAAATDGQLGVWDARSGSCIFQESIGKGDQGKVDALEVSPNGQLIALSTEFKVRLFDANDGKELNMDNSKGHHGWVRDLCFSHDGKTLASVGSDRQLVLWDVEKMSVRKKVDVLEESYSVSFSHSDSTIATGSTSGIIRLWNAQTGNMYTPPIAGHKNVVLKLCFSRDDSMILSSSGDQTASLWDLDGTCVQRFAGASGWMYDAVFTPDEDEIITSSSDMTVRIWCVAGGEESMKLDGHLGSVLRLAMMNNGLLASSDSNGLIKIWRIPDLPSVADEIRRRQTLE